MSDNGYTQKEMLGVLMADIDKIYSKLEDIQKDLQTRLCKLSAGRCRHDKAQRLAFD